MLIDNFSADLLANLVCPVSRDPLSTDGLHLYTPSGYTYWHGDFRIEPSVTDAEAKIIVARGVRRKRGSR